MNPSIEVSVAEAVAELSVAVAGVDAVMWKDPMAGETLKWATPLASVVAVFVPLKPVRETTWPGSGGDSDAVMAVGVFASIVAGDVISSVAGVSG